MPNNVQLRCKARNIFRKQQILWSILSLSHCLTLTKLQLIMIMHFMLLVLILPDFSLTYEGVFTGSLQKDIYKLFTQPKLSISISPVQSNIENSILGPYLVFDQIFSDSLGGGRGIGYKRTRGKSKITKSERTYFMDGMTANKTSQRKISSSMLDCIREILILFFLQGLYFTGLYLAGVHR